MHTTDRRHSPTHSFKGGCCDLDPAYTCALPTGTAAPPRGFTETIGQICASDIKTPPPCPASVTAGDTAGTDLTNCAQETIVKAPATRTYSQGRHSANAPYQWWVGPDVGLAECQRICKEDLVEWGCAFVSYLQGPGDPHCYGGTPRAATSVATSTAPSGPLRLKRSMAADRALWLMSPRRAPVIKSAE